jgi:hypothetical protein
MDAAHLVAGQQSLVTPCSSCRRRGPPHGAEAGALWGEEDRIEHSRSSSPPLEDGPAMRRQDLATSGRLQLTMPEAPAPRDLVPMMPLHSRLELDLPRSYAIGRKTKRSDWMFVSCTFPVKSAS